MRLIAVLGVLFVLASCSDSDMEFNCKGLPGSPDSNMKLLEDELVLIVSKFQDTEIIYYYSHGLATQKYYKNLSGDVLIYYPEQDNISGCKRIK